MKKRMLIGFLTMCAVYINEPIASAQEWTWRDPLDFEHIHGVKQFHNVLLPVGLLTSLLLTKSIPMESHGIGFIRPSSWFIHSRTGYYKGYKSAGKKNNTTDILEWNIGFGYYFRKWLALGMDVYATGFIDSNFRTVGGGGGPFVRWHLISKQRWSLYFEQGVGVIFSKSEFPPRGTKINFIPTYGLGVSFKLFPHIYFLMSIRHYHLSNGGLIDDDGKNPGFDSNGFYIGGQFQF